MLAIYLFAAFDTSCFSGKYVTGEVIGDSYFTKLYDLRNDAAKQKKNDGKQSNGTSKMMPRGSNEGCESMVNDTRGATNSADAGCESITNDDAAR